MPAARDATAGTEEQNPIIQNGSDLNGTGWKLKRA
jgi:hypothetical protein